jgi:two-component system C4-dicarboxylate transport response regulator DctD
MANEVISILLVDDDEGLRHTISQWLSQQSLKVDIAATGLHAIQKLKANPHFRVVVSDVKMPGLNGINMVKKIKEEVPAFAGQVILISGHATVDHIKEAKALGAYAFLVKPFMPKDLYDKIVQAASEPPSS